nr:FkbM family methyltransferase [Candidatus Njordarchaeum guaymaensis]
MNLPREKLFNAGLRFLSFVTFLGHGKEKTTIYDVNHSAKFELRVKTMDKFVVWETWNLNEYRDPNFEIEPADIVVDIGAHIGAFSVYAAMKAHKGEVYSYEPGKGNYHMLLKNKILNNLDNIHPFNLAISDKRGSLDFYIGSDNVVNSIYGNGSGKRIRVQAVTIEDILARNNLDKIDYLKMDAEGAEYNIILRMPSETLGRIDKLAVEYHDRLDSGHGHEELKKHLEENGFEVKIHNFPVVTRVFGTGVLRAKRLAA